MLRKLVSTVLKGKDWIEHLPVATLITSRYHWYNMVSPSPWPILIGITSFPGVIGLVGTMHGIINGLELFILSFLTFLFFFCMWNRDIVRESTFMGLHTKQVDKNTITGFKLFLFTETMLFVTFFWAHLYSALYPSVFIGLSWPPIGLGHLLLDPFDIPLTNTIILVYSGFTVTVSHLYLRRGRIVASGWAMFISILLGMAFLYIQKEEFFHSQFNISDGVYGSTFFMLTGFHGGHVIIGVTGLIITLIRLLELHFSSYSHTGFKLALIYWHFVDVVWIFVFIIVYVIGFDLTHPNALFFTYNPQGGPQIDYGILNLDVASYGKYRGYLDVFSGSNFSSREPIFQYRKWNTRLGRDLIIGSNFQAKKELNHYVLKVSEGPVLKRFNWLHKTNVMKPNVKDGSLSFNFFHKLKINVTDTRQFFKFGNEETPFPFEDRQFEINGYFFKPSRLLVTHSSFTANMRSFLINDQNMFEFETVGLYMGWLEMYVKWLDAPYWQPYPSSDWTKIKPLDPVFVEYQMVKNYKK
uniref:Cytochrome c oxidase subunit 3 n=1 Tax=Paramoeba aparasomata TaxID=2583407 RepID=A0A5P8HBH9_9EUKA|nr:cytochrome oxidase subunit 3 [Paramoeba aparasomata]